MRNYRWLAIPLIALLVLPAGATELVPVPGSNVQYANPFPAKIQGKEVKLVLTGAAVRKKYLFSVYTVGSYVAEGSRVKTAEDLVALDAPKRLHLVMERDVGGPDMAEAFRSAIRMNYPEPAFADELTRLMEFMRPLTAKKGEHVWLTWLPGQGLHCQILGKTEVMIRGPAFARAVWEIYLGKHNLGEAIKQGLVSRL